jgi:hypothetical protein
MGEVATRIVIQTKQLLVAGLVAHQVPLLAGKLARIGDADLLEGRHLDAGVQNRPIGGQVGIGSAMRLYVGVFGAEKRASLAAGEILDDIHIVATGVEPVEGKAFRILVGKEVSHGELAGETGIVLACDQLEVRALVGQFLHYARSHERGYLRHTFEGGEIGDESAINRLHGSLSQILLQQGGTFHDAHSFCHCFQTAVVLCLRIASLSTETVIGRVGDPTSDCKAYPHIIHAINVKRLSVFSRQPVCPTKKDYTWTFSTTL